MKIIEINKIPISYSHHGTIKRKALLKKSGKKSSILSMNKAFLEPGGEIEQHYHFDAEEIFFFVKGAGKIIIEKEAIEVDNRYLFLIEPKEKHIIRNDGQVDLEFITILVKKQE